ncbi:MAG: U32 family peptidase [Firmicutes bacterium]|nr:U32 family peptidase [Bacillota bacterium]
MENNEKKQYRISVSVAITDELEKIDMSGVDLLIAGYPYCRQTFKNPIEDLYSVEKTVEIMKPYLDKVIISLPVCPIDRELVYVGRMLEYLCTTGIHGVEVHSAGMAYKVNAHYPSLRTYFGCFANVYTDQCANVLRDMNVVGGVFPYELNLEEIEFIKNHSDIEIWLPVFGNYPVAFSQYCYFHPEQTDYPFHCGKECSERVVVDYGDDRMVIHRGRVIFSHKILNMLTHMEMLLKKGFSNFRIAGLLLQAETINEVIKIFRTETENILAAIEKGQSADPAETAKLIKKLEIFAPDGFSNGFFFTKRGMDYIENFYKFSAV